MSKKDINNSEENLDNKELESAEQEETTEKEEQKEVKEEEKELEETKTRLLRLQADFDNYKKRVEKEKIAIIQYASSNLVEKLLPVLDNFDRALSEENRKEENSEGFFEGVEMIRNQIIEALSSEGVKEIAAFEEPFDPNYHNAIQQVESDKHESNTVVEVYQKGYQLKDRVIRPSMVVVAK